MLKIGLSGSTGLIGTRITELLSKEFEFVHLLQSEVNITNNEEVSEAIRNMDFDIFLHLAAFTNVNAAEKDKQLIHDVNVQGTKNVFDAVMNKDKKFIYISTDFVFDGINPPYYEDSKPHPVGYYGQTKFEGEQIVGNNAMIVRLSYPYRAKYELKKDFVNSIATILKEKKELHMVTDSIMTPSFIDDIVYSLRYCFTHFSHQILHLVGSDSMSPYEAGKTIARLFGLDSSYIKPTTYAEYFRNKAKRPRFSEMKSKKNTFYKMKTFEEGLNEIIKQLGNS